MNVQAMILAYLLIGFVFWVMVATDLALDLLGTLVGVAFYILSFPYWFFHAARAWYVTRTA